jgi:hypothetical protein
LTAFDQSVLQNVAFAFGCFAFGCFAFGCIALGCCAIGERAMAVTFCVDAFECSGVAIPLSAAPIGRSLLSLGGGSAQRFCADRGSDMWLGLLGLLVTIGCCVVAERRAVITLLRCPIALVGRVISPVGGSVTVIGCLVSLRIVPANHPVSPPPVIVTIGSG